MEDVSFEDFKKVDVRIGKIISAEKMENSEKLLKLRVDFGTETRQIISGIAKYYQPEQLIGKECPFVFNLAVKMLNEQESQGMILCADGDRPVLLHPDKEVPPGSVVK